MPSDEPINVGATPAAEAPAASGAEAIAQATPAPVADAAATPAVGAEGGVAEGTAPAAEPPHEADGGVKLHTDTPSLLEEAGKAKDPAATEPAAPAEPVVAAPDAPVAYQPFTLPEGVTADEKRIAAYSEIAGRYKIPQEDAQALLDMHTSTMQAFAEQTAAQQHEQFANYRREQRERIKGDAEIGGAGFDTSAKAVARMRDLLVPKEHREEFDQMCRVTGCGDHLAFWRILHNAARFFDEPSPPAVSGVSAAPQPKNNGRGKGSLGSVLYDSQAMVNLRN